MPLSLVLSFLVVPWLVSVGIRLPDVLEGGIDQRFTDQDAQINHQVGIHRSAKHPKTPGLNVAVSSFE